MNKNKIKNFWKNPIVIICIFAVGYWIYTYHLEHALGFLPYGILLLCPFMHIFMHGNHSHDHSHRIDGDKLSEEYNNNETQRIGEEN